MRNWNHIRAQHAMEMGNQSNARTAQLIRLLPGAKVSPQPADVVSIMNRWTPGTVRDSRPCHGALAISTLHAGNAGNVHAPHSNRTSAPARQSCTRCASTISDFSDEKLFAGGARTVQTMQILLDQETPQSICLCT